MGPANNGQCWCLCLIRAKIKFRNVFIPQRHSHSLTSFTLFILFISSSVKMKSSRRSPFISSTAAASATTVIYTFQNDHSAPEPGSKFTETPTADGKPTEPIPITVHIPPHPRSGESSAAVKIQSAYRAHVVRNLIRKVSSVNSEANYWQRIIQRQAWFQLLNSL